VGISFEALLLVAVEESGKIFTGREKKGIKVHVPVLCLEMLAIFRKRKNLWIRELW
jgi:hypothetical protein